MYRATVHQRLRVALSTCCGTRGDVEALAAPAVPRTLQRREIEAFSDITTTMKGLGRPCYWRDLVTTGPCSEERDLYYFQYRVDLFANLVVAQDLCT